MPTKIVRTIPRPRATIQPIVRTIQPRPDAPKPYFAQGGLYGVLAVPGNYAGNAPVTNRGLEIVPGLGQTVENLNTLGENISSGEFWLKAGVGILGLILIVVGLVALAQKPARAVAETVNPTAQLAKRLRKR